MRGRKKDQTIPPSRSVVHQRDFRARKAQYISSLEERCRAAEEENSRLRREIELTRATRLAESSAQTTQMAATSSALWHQLNAASNAIVHFQQLASLSQPQEYPDNPPAPPPSLLSPAPPRTHNSHGNHLLDTIDLQHSGQMATSGENSGSTDELSFPGGHLSRSPNTESDCCGGWMSCRGFVEDADRDRVGTTGEPS